MSTGAEFRPEPTQLRQRQGQDGQGAPGGELDVSSGSPGTCGGSALSDPQVKTGKTFGRTPDGTGALWDDGVKMHILSYELPDLEKVAC